MERMESLLIEMHKKMDELKQEKYDADVECKEVTKCMNRIEKDFEILQQDSKQQRQMWEQEIEQLEQKLKES